MSNFLWYKQNGNWTKPSILSKKNSYVENILYYKNKGKWVLLGNNTTDNLYNPNNWNILKDFTFSQVGNYDYQVVSSDGKRKIIYYNTCPWTGAEMYYKNIGIFTRGFNHMMEAPNTACPNFNNNGYIEIYGIKGTLQDYQMMQWIEIPGNSNSSYRLAQGLIITADDDTNKQLIGTWQGWGLGFKYEPSFPLKINNKLKIEFKNSTGQYGGRQDYFLEYEFYFTM